MIPFSSDSPEIRKTRELAATPKIQRAMALARKVHYIVNAQQEARSCEKRPSVRRPGHAPRREYPPQGLSPAHPCRAIVV